jgi:4-hydroxybenzoate polyprenyltransferase
MGSPTISLPAAPLETRRTYGLATPVLSAAQRLWIYQRERFPVFGHGLLIAAFSSSAVSFSCILRGRNTLPAAASILVAFCTSFLFFFQLRVADEFKDALEDARWRPYRPVPRGLVTLRELCAIGCTAGLLQVGLAGFISWRLVVLLLLVWSYLALMTKEFFVREWLEQQPLNYLWTHMLIIPLADFYATACDWAKFGASPPPGLFWFLATSFCNGFALEIGRKIRAPDAEEAGVRTYTSLWGTFRASLAWLAALLATGVCAEAAASRIRFAWPTACLIGLMLGLVVFAATRFVVHPTTNRARRIDRLSGLWTLAIYLFLGAVPMLNAWIRASR